MAGKVVVFGSFVVDLMARIPHLPVPGETVKGPMFKMGPGGKGFNQGAAAHKAGADVTMVTKIGKDSFGDIALHTMDELGMTKEHVFISEEDKTGIALILVDENTSQNEIAIVSGACGTITEKDTNSVKELIRESEYILLQLEVNQDANERIAEYACENGVKVIINTAPYSKISDEFLSKAYMVTPNEVEAEALTGIKVEDLESAKKAATIFKKKGVKKVLITLGEKGVFISDDDKDEILPAFHVNAVDTTGAGDAFNGGFITALAEGKDIWEAAKFANAAAALSVQKLATTPSMPARKEIDEFLSTHA